MGGGVAVADIAEKLEEAGYYEAAGFIRRLYGPTVCVSCRGKGYVNGVEYPNHSFVSWCSACGGTGTIAREG